MNINMKICSECGEFHYTTETSCPHCESKHHKNTTKISKAAILLGLGLTACDRLGPEPMPLYGAPFDTSDLLIDEDGDGYDVEQVEKTYRTIRRMYPEKRFLVTNFKGDLISIEHSHPPDELFWGKNKFNLVNNYINLEYCDHQFLRYASQNLTIYLSTILHS